MVYARPFHRLVIAGDLFADTFNTTLSIIEKPGSEGSMGLPLPTELLGGINLAIQDFWGTFPSGSGPGIHQAAIYKSFKLNLIGTDGKYMRDETTEYIAATPTPGGGQTGPFPAQLATVVTLRTAAERGRASKGRMFLPVCDGFGVVAADGRAAQAAAERVANATAALVADINAVYAAAVSGDESLGVVGVVSNIGTGTQREVTSITCGRVTDTIRSRRNKQIEAPEEASLP